MVLHTREFDVNGDTIIMGHDRETGVRYLCIEATPEFIRDPRGTMTTISRLEYEAMASVFWIE